MLQVLTSRLRSRILMDVLNISFKISNHDGGLNISFKISNHDGGLNISFKISNHGGGPNISFKISNHDGMGDVDQERPGQKKVNPGCAASPVSATSPAVGCTATPLFLHVHGPRGSRNFASPSVFIFCFGGKFCVVAKVAMIHRKI